MKIKTIVIGNICADQKAYVSRIPYLNLIGTYTDPTEALSIIKQGEAELAFFDADTPFSIDATDFVKRLHNPPKTIFISSTREKAVEAFDANAVDFLLKPFSFERFLVAVERASGQVVKKPNHYDFIFVNPNTTSSSCP